MKPTDVARQLDISPAGVRAAIRRGALPAVRVLGRWRIDPAAVEALARGIPSPTRKDANASSPPPRSP